MDNPKTRRPRRTNKDLRNDILNAASEVIKNEGFAKSSLMRIVNLAKVESTVFHRHFGDWEEFMDIYTRKYDYWFSDVIDSIEKNQCTEKEFRSIMHGLFDDLNSNIIMQELLKWEICIIRKSKFPQNPKRSVRFSGKRTKRSVQKRKARNTQKAETKVL